MHVLCVHVSRRRFECVRVVHGVLSGPVRRCGRHVRLGERAAARRREVLGGTWRKHPAARRGGCGLAPPRTQPPGTGHPGAVAGSGLSTHGEGGGCGARARACFGSCSCSTTLRKEKKRARASSRRGEGAPATGHRASGECTGGMTAVRLARITSVLPTHKNAPDQPGGVAKKLGQIRLCC